MNLKEKLMMMTTEDIIEAAVKIAKYAKLNTDEVHTDGGGDGCLSHAGQCGVCINNVWIPCS